ncbi:hypothetical protein [Peribacillus frigoritolerans]|uniref:hypothetical protein n=1 Tax=Peribacillus castrilensis TaxID=2897690 RepID=UPI00296EEB96|nr:hypothetical protein [Peribacillus castrilensis]
MVIKIGASLIKLGKLGLLVIAIISSQIYSIAKESISKKELLVLKYHFKSYTLHIDFRH